MIIPISPPIKIKKIAEKEIEMKLKDFPESQSPSILTLNAHKATAKEIVTI